ncbi:MAG TPA: hypothetical protein VFL84_13675 [Gammaproteobacteria bacterium]|nr:hypothetical protein [Gammaproteobacteria bacterium]
MRLSALAISGAAVALAIALVAYFRPGGEPPLVSKSETPPVQEVPVANEPAAAPPLEATVFVPPAAESRAGAGPVPSIEPAPLPGATATTPMADLMAGRGTDRPMPALIERERAFAVEPVDRTWAPAAEARIYAKLAEIPGLKLIGLQVECRSTMCRIQTESSGGSSLPFKDLLGPAGLEPAWMATIKERNGPVRSAAYLWRDGFAPPTEPLQPRDTN